MKKLILLLLWICLIPVVHSFAQTEGKASQEIISVPNALQFFVIGDWGRKGQMAADRTEVKNQKSLAAMMNDVGFIVSPSFIISTGDNFYPDGVKNDKDPRWKETFEDVYTGVNLQHPWYVVLGNHDHHGNVQGEIDYDKSNERRRWFLPSNYYTKVMVTPDGAKIKFIFIDTTPLVKSPDEAQLKWLSKELSEGGYDWKWVVGHHPLYSGNHRVGEQNKLRDSIEQLLIDNNVDVYLCGHDHNLQYLKKGNIKYFISGAGSEIYKSENLEGLTQYVYCRDGDKCTSAFMVFSVEKSSLYLQMIDSNGQLIYKKTIQKTDQ